MSKPSIDTPPSYPEIDSNEILDELDRAIVNHLEWLKEWHRNIICGGTPYAPELAYDPHHLCRFGSWYVRNQHTGLVNQPVIRNLANLHHDMHDRAQKLLEKSGTAPLPRKEYEAFMDTTSAFVIQTRRVEKAFTAATGVMDPLTGLHNRLSEAVDLERERERVARGHASCCIALADLDHFKKVNDNHGHAMGDKVLISAAERFLACLRSYDTIYRHGGEEFLICLPEADIETATAVVERLRLSLENHRIDLPTGGELKVTGSFGLAIMDDTASVDEIIDRADQALYAAKKAGRNRIVVWNADLQSNG